MITTDTTHTILIMVLDTILGTMTGTIAQVGMVDHIQMSFLLT